jgi:hypothetical protein
MNVEILQAALIRGTPAEDRIRAQYLTGNKKRSVPWSDKDLERLIVRDLLRLAMTDFTYLDEAKCSATYIWLKDNAARFGFRRTVPTEAWHWAHPDSAIVTTNENIPTEELLVASVKATASGVVAIQTAKSEATLILDRAVHDVSKAHERSVQMTRTTRQQLYAESARVAVYHGAALKTIASKYENQLASMALPLPEYTEGAVEKQSYDYTTKRWGDGSLT